MLLRGTQALGRALLILGLLFALGCKDDSCFALGCPEQETTSQRRAALLRPGRPAQTNVVSEVALWSHPSLVRPHGGGPPVGPLTSGYCLPAVGKSSVGFPHRSRVKTYRPNYSTSYHTRTNCSQKARLDACKMACPVWLTSLASWM